MADDKKKLQKSASQAGSGKMRVTTTDDADDFIDELGLKNDKLEKENNELIRKLDEFKQLYLEAQKKNKIVTPRIDTGLHPSAGPKRTTSGNSLRGNISGNSLRAQGSRTSASSLRRVEKSKTDHSLGRNSANIDLEHRLAAAIEENNNMLEAISVLQRKIAEGEAERYHLKRQIDQKNEMLSFTGENNQKMDQDYQTEITKSRNDIRRLYQSIQDWIYSVSPIKEFAYLR